MKKLLALILVAALCVALLAGCGTAETTTSEPPAEDSSAPSEDAGGNTAATELKLWLPVYQFGDGISDEDFWNEKLDAFEAENNCTVTVEIQGWTDYATNIYTGLLSAEGPDVVYVTETYDIISSDLIIPLDPYLTQDDYDLYLYLEQGAYNSNGELCTFPMIWGQRSRPIFLFLPNKSLLHIPLPVTCLSISPAAQSYVSFPLWQDGKERFSCQ